MVVWRWSLELFIFARFHASAGYESAVAEALDAVVRPSREEPGCLSISPFCSSRGSRAFFLHSRPGGKTGEASPLHPPRPHALRSIDGVPPLINQPPVGGGGA